MIRGLADALLPTARKLIKEKYGAVKAGNKDFKPFFTKEQPETVKIVEVYENYTAAFGMIVNQSGFKSAFAIYNEEKTNSEGNRKIITQLLYEILRDHKEKEIQEKMIREDNYQKCCENILDGIHDSDAYEDLFKEASIALKRAIRTFEIVKK